MISKILIYHIKEWNAYLTPTQLLIQGQWWSNLSTHLEQILQCLLLGVLITPHSGQRQLASNTDKSSINLRSGSGSTKPGLILQAIKQKVVADENVIKTASLKPTFVTTGKTKQ